MALRRTQIVAEALEWRDTPYVHQASLKGVGCDCLGLVRGVWRRFFGAEPEALPAYTPDWAELHGQETLLAAAERWLAPVELESAQPGDVLLFRMFTCAPAKHCAIILPERRMIHAYWARAVVVSRIADWWRARVCAAFSFPGVE